MCLRRLCVGPTAWTWSIPENNCLELNRLLLPASSWGAPNMITPSSAKKPLLNGIPRHSCHQSMHLCVLAVKACALVPRHVCSNTRQCVMIVINRLENSTCIAFFFLFFFLRGEGMWKRIMLSLYELKKTEEVKVCKDGWLRLIMNWKGKKKEKKKRRTW